MKQNILTIMGATIVAVMLFIPLPKIMIYILFGIDTAALVFFEILSVIQKMKGMQPVWFPRFVLFWILATLVIVISAGRIILTANNSEIQSLLTSKEITNKYLILSFLVFVLLTTADLIHLRLCNKRLKDEWGKVKDRGIKEEIEFYRNLAGSIKFLTGLFTFTLFMTAVIFLGRSLVDNTQYSIAMNVALRKNLILAMDISIIIQALITLCTFNCSLCVDSTSEK